MTVCKTRRNEALSLVSQKDTKNDEGMKKLCVLQEGQEMDDLGRWSVGHITDDLEHHVVCWQAASSKMPLPPQRSMEIVPLAKVCCKEQLNRLARQGRHRDTTAGMLTGNKWEDSPFSVAAKFNYFIFPCLQVQRASYACLHTSERYQWQGWTK